MQRGHKPGILRDFSLNVENSWNSQGILCSLAENWLCALGEPLSSNPYADKCIWCTKTVHLSSMWRWDRLLLVTWVVVDLWCMKVIIMYTFCCDNLWKSIIMALENSRKFFSYFVVILLSSVGWEMTTSQGTLVVVLFGWEDNRT